QALAMHLSSSGCVSSAALIIKLKDHDSAIKECDRRSGQSSVQAEENALKQRIAYFTARVDDDIKAAKEKREKEEADRRAAAEAAERQAQEASAAWWRSVYRWSVAGTGALLVLLFSIMRTEWFKAWREERRYRRDEAAIYGVGAGVVIKQSRPFSDYFRALFWL